MGKVSDIPWVLYSDSMWTMYYERDWWANDAAKSPQTLTGATAQMMAFPGAPSSWTGTEKRYRIADRARLLNRRFWANLGGTRYADARAAVEYLERECGDLIDGYVLIDEPKLSHVATIRDQQKAVREASTKPSWLNLTATNQGDWAAILQGIGSSDMRLWPEILTVDAYPRSFTDSATPAQPFHNQWQSGVNELPGDTGQEAGVDWYLSALVFQYMTASRRFGVRLSPANGHVLGVIGQCFEQFAWLRPDRNTAQFLTWFRWDNTQAEKMEKYMLGRSPFDGHKTRGIAAGYTASDFRADKVVDGHSLLQFRSCYVSMHAGHDPRTIETTWAATARTGLDAERGALLVKTRSPDVFAVADAAKHGKTYGDGLADITGDVMYPAGAAEPALSGQCFPPRVTPFGVFYDVASVDVTMSCDTAGVTIRYTTDGSTPNGSSTEYTAPVTVSASTLIRAIAIKGGLSNSPVATRRLNFVSTTLGVNLTAVKWYTPSGKNSQLNGAVFQGSNDGSSWTTFYTISSNPPNGYTTQAVTPAARYRYLRLYHASNKVAVADLQWLYDTEELVGTPTSSACVAGREVVYAYDGSTSSYCEVAANGGYIGLDTGEYSPPRKPALLPGALTLAPGASGTVSVTNLNGRTISVENDAPAVCSVVPTATSFTVTGLVAGVAQLTVTVGDGNVLTMVVTVSAAQPQPTPIITPASVTVGETAEATATVTQLGTRTISSVASGAPATATVAFVGTSVRVTGVAAGSTTVTVTLSDGTTLSLAVVVQASPPAAVPNLSPASLDLTRGESAAVRVLDLGGLTWTAAASNSAVISVVRATTGDAFTVTGLTTGETSVVVSLSDASTLVLPVDVTGSVVTPAPTGKGLWASVPR